MTVETLCTPKMHGSVIWGLGDDACVSWQGSCPWLDQGVHGLIGKGKHTLQLVHKGLGKDNNEQRRKKGKAKGKSCRLASDTYELDVWIWTHRPGFPLFSVERHRQYMWPRSGTMPRRRWLALDSPAPLLPQQRNPGQWLQLRHLPLWHLGWCLPSSFSVNKA